MAEKVDSTVDEPMDIHDPPKQRVSDEQDPAKAAMEILQMLDGSGIEDSPEVKKVKDMVKQLEGSLQEKHKRTNPGSSASSAAGSYVVLGDDPMKPKSPRSKKHATA